MKVANLNSMPEHQAQLSRTGFDMSQEFTFTSSVGMILPVYQDFLNVGESVHFSGTMITRTQPLVTAAMADVDVYLDWFFVPASMLFLLWPSKRWLTNDLVSSMFEGTVQTDKFPLFSVNSYLTNEGSYDYSESASYYYDNWFYLDDKFECLGKSQFRLANHFGFNPYGIFRGNPDAETAYASANNPNVFPVFPLAYQAIFNDYYRLPVDDYLKRLVTSFNVDNFFTAVTPSVDVNVSLFCLHYRPRYKDYFTSVKASPLMSAVNSLVDATQTSNYLSKIDSFLSGTSVQTGGAAETYFDVGSQSTQVIEGSPSASKALGTAQIRNMFAAEKLLRVTGRAKKDYDSQVLAHFGFKVPHDVKHELTHICQQYCVIHIGEVISTSDTFNGDTGSALGAIGGKGYGIIQLAKGQKPFRFTAPVDGVFMCCYSSAPRQRYYGTFDKQNSLTDRLSFYQPEFDKLGMQPLFDYESAGYFDSTTNRVGWQFRYEQWKRKYNRVSEAFGLSQNRNAVNQNVSWVNGTRPYATAFSFAPAQPTNDAKGLFVSPKDLNQIMVVPYTPDWSAAYLTNPQAMFYTDPFIHAFRAEVKKVSTMSSFGEPDLNGF